MTNASGRILLVCLALMLSPVCLALGQDQQEEQSEEQSNDTHELEYAFALTKVVDSSSMADPFKPFLFILTVPLDLAVLPFALIGEAFAG